MKEKKRFPALESCFFPISIKPTSEAAGVHWERHFIFEQGISNMATASKSTDGKAAPAKKRTPNAAFMKPLTPSPALAAVVGSAPLPRTEIISKLWTYIKANNLQDAANKRMINADAKLKEVFGKPQVSMFEMAGLIGKHVK